MRFTTKTEYGLVCLIYMAKKHSGELITVKEIVEKEHFSTTYLEKILQKLKNAGIVTSHQGKQGGYALARPASEITLKHIIEALEGNTFDVFCQPEIREEIVCTHFTLCGLKPIWQKAKDVLDSYFSSITLDALAQHGGAAVLMQI